MKIFNLSAEVTISIYTQVEADTLEEAIIIAESRNIEAGRWHDKTQATQAWVSNEYDGEPVNIHES